MRPYVVINSAMSADGKISTIARKQVRISGEDDLRRVDALKADVDAVMVGVGTVLADDPKLTVKSIALKRRRVGRGRTESPLRVVVDSSARTPPTAAVLGSNALIATSRQAPRHRVEELETKAEILVVGERKVDLATLLGRLKDRGVKSLLVEGGATLNFALLSLGLVDEIYTYVGNIIIGGSAAPTLVDGEGLTSDFVKLNLQEVRQIGDGVLIKWRVISF
ncbi:MAG TPA: 2,5-diamino-6-(ribosylamino)-4(3H)-pyrimidinone 5'-phosphate reductase [Candidatus Bathyarchaeia archaeon]|nr:2,5-diamino-6-(ribosylamino)-4(3H)-pyrimidinone 5'-phosphate reductase [Candidatus Bathyarchaeia archaeon]